MTKNEFREISDLMSEVEWGDLVQLATFRDNKRQMEVAGFMHKTKTEPYGVVTIELGTENPRQEDISFTRRIAGETTIYTNYFTHYRILQKYNE